MVSGEWLVVSVSVGRSRTGGRIASSRASISVLGVRCSVECLVFGVQFSVMEVKC